ncbi:helix-turn-helix transcriptional regulator [Methylobacterium sp. CM6247]
MTEELIDLIYAVLLGETSWQQFLDTLAAGIPNGKVVMVMHGIASPEQGYVPLNAGFEDRSIEIYNAHYAALNVWQPPLTRRAVGIGFIDDELFPPQKLVASEFFNDYLIPNDIKAMACAKIGDVNHYSFSIATLSAQSDHQLKKVMADRLTGLGPHLKRAFDYHRKGANNRAAAEIGVALFDAIGIGVVVIGDDASVKTISTAGQAMLTKNSPVRISPLGRFGLRDAQLQVILNGMLERKYAGPKVVSQFSHKTKLTFILVNKDCVSLYFEGPTVIVLMEQLGRGATAFDPQLVSLVYGLTKAETRAVSGIATGKSVDQIAQDASLSRETIRAQMKSLYAKTGASSEADILRLIGFNPA